jgi:hypothetical protein
MFSSPKWPLHAFQPKFVMYLLITPSIPITLTDIQLFNLHKMLVLNHDTCKWKIPHNLRVNLLSHIFELWEYEIYDW